VGQVLARGDLRDDTAENSMRVLGKNDVAGDPTLEDHGG
jgi:hypothetical protein